MLPAGLEPTFPASERPQTHALGRTATGNTNEPINSAITQHPLWRGSHSIMFWGSIMDRIFNLKRCSQPTSHTKISL